MMIKLAVVLTHAVLDSCCINTYVLFSNLTFSAERGGEAEKKQREEKRRRKTKWRIEETGSIRNRWSM